MSLPSATYRLQFGPHLDLEGARRLVPYLHALGVSDLYASPLMASRRGSAHGYDVVDPSRVNPELGGEEGLGRLSEELRRHGMGLVLDIVPNHMAASEENPWWLDVLRRGRGSPHARWFDIDWRTGRREHAGRVCLPILGEPYGEALAAGRFTVERDGSGGGDSGGDSGGGGFALRYGERRLPLRGEPRADLDGWLQEQPYRLAFWRVANREGNYRRFFDVNDLVALRAENAAVFAASHRRVLDLVAAGQVTALRVDHVDGLADPLGYLRRLAVAAAVPVVVEKILGADEELPQRWPVAGTTGYEFLNLAGGLFVDPEGARRLQRAAPGPRFAEVARRQKRRVARELFAGEVARLGRDLGRLAARDPAARDLTLVDLEQAVVELTAWLPVYRTYIRPGRAVRQRDRGLIEAAAEAAGRQRPELRAALGFLRDVLLGGRVGGNLPDGPPRRSRGAAAVAVAVRWQQLSGPVAAKGVEDTALYLRHPLASLCEVGGDPDATGTSPEEFHRASRRRLRRWPGGLLATSTHDTKRSEDVRLRLHVLSEMPGEWLAAVERWRAWNRRWKRRVDGRIAPGAGIEDLVYQTLVGAWPLDPAELDGFGDRVEAYALKAAREGKEETAWLRPDPGREAALVAFVRGVLSDRRFVADLEALLRPVAFYGALNSLSQVVLKAASPGVPDLYQGSEMWDLSLVDPDNRRPVDFARRAAALAELTEMDAPAAVEGRGQPSALLSGWRDGRVKLFVTARALRLRRSRRALFTAGEHLGLFAEGSCGGHVCAFARHLGGQWALAAVPRLLVRLLGPEPRLPLGESVWGDDALVLPPGAPEMWRDAFTGARIAAQNGRLRLAGVFGAFPVAVMVED